MLKFDVKFDDKKIKAAAIREAEKVVTEKVSSQGPVVQKRVEIVCKNCGAKFFTPIADGICPHCRKPLN